MCFHLSEEKSEHLHSFASSLSHSRYYVVSFFTGVKDSINIIVNTTHLRFLSSSSLRSRSVVLVREEKKQNAIKSQAWKSDGVGEGETFSFIAYGLKWHRHATNERKNCTQQQREWRKVYKHSAKISLLETAWSRIECAEVCCDFFPVPTSEDFPSLLSCRRNV